VKGLSFAVGKVQGGRQRRRRGNGEPRR
jgi:hypothetical protein